MIRAYHYVAGGAAAFDSINDGGKEILPSAMRLAVSQIDDLCSELIDTLEFAVNRRDIERPISANAVKAIKQIIEERKRQFRKIGRPEQAEGEHATQIRCEDVIAGDIWRVYLSPHDWERNLFSEPWKNDRGLREAHFVPNGFVFDAEGLIRRGAAFRPDDFFESYETMVTELVWHGKYKTVATARRAIETKLNRIHKNALVGSEAVEFLRETAKNDASVDPYGEIVWNGPLPIGLAVEAWRDGERLMDRMATQGEVMETWVKEVLEFANRRHLNLSAHREVVPIRGIEVTEGTDPRAVAAIKERLKRGSDLWPKDLPLIVLESNIGEGFANEGYAVLDGHHRLQAAEELGYSEIPALTVSTLARLEIASEFDIPRVDYIQHILAAVEPLIFENVKKGVGGKPKKRSW